MRSHTSTLVSASFLERLKTIPIINFHPTLPGQFDGANAIPRAYDAYKAGSITKTGVMIHKVIPQVDAGDVVCKREIAIDPHDTLEDLEGKIHSVEHSLIVEGVKVIQLKLVS